MANNVWSGYAIPFLLNWAMEIPGLVLIPVGIAEQSKISELREVIPKVCLTHDQPVILLWVWFIVEYYRINLNTVTELVRYRHTMLCLLLQAPNCSTTLIRVRLQGCAYCQLHQAVYPVQPDP
jgi:hypothetical protein